MPGAERWLASHASSRATRASHDSMYASMEGGNDENRSPTPASRRPGRPTIGAAPEATPEERSSTVFRSGNERLYEAYNDLHSLAQDFEKPFDAPAILVVGHQTDGKSALIEALMGFQFNHVGGGTKTRRPITLHMQYNAGCVQPQCFLVTEDFGDQEVTLEELQEYIENENSRLEREHQFWAKEIIVRMEYKYCPNLSIIDTPGLIAAAPGKRNGQLQASARQVEGMVRAKMEQKEYIILCLEDSNDWSNATTRRLVMQTDPSLQRTVVVSTKLDTRIPQFARGQDVELFLHPPGRQLEPSMLGGSPFFTSVPSGRVGGAKDALFQSNERFREAVRSQEDADVAVLETRMSRPLDKGERARIGVSQLRRFLEQLLQRRYLENVPTIVPLLEREFRSAAAKLSETQAELSDLAADRLKERGRAFREVFLSRLGLLLRGTVAAPPEKFGETLADEHIQGGAFVGPDGRALPVPPGLPNAHMRLYGGAQYHRAMAEFRCAVGAIACPDITREEIVNACGVDDFHDGVNYMRTACVIAVSRARDMFEPFVHQLGYRFAHVLRRMLPIALHLLAKEGAGLTGHDLFLKRVGACFHAFVEEVESATRTRCLEDLTSTTRYVTWSLHTKSSTAMTAMLRRMPAVQEEASATAGGRDARAPAATAAAGAGGGGVAEMLESTLWSRQLGPLSEQLVAALVCQIFEGIRDQVVTTVELKFNCFFLMPLLDAFPGRLREELETAYAQDLDGVFDVRATRSALDSRLRSLESELHQVESLQRKFASIHLTLAQQQEQAAGAKPGTTQPTGPPPEPLRMSALNRIRTPETATTPPSKAVTKLGKRLEALEASRTAGRGPLSANALR